MVLKEIKFSRFKGEKNEWSIEGKPDGSGITQPLTLENINLIVGLNASGKSRTIDVIRNIADLVSSDVKLSQLNDFNLGTEKYLLIFEDLNREVEYFIEFKKGKIIQETLSIDGLEKLNRKDGKLYYEGEDKELDFQTDDDILAVTKRDKKQHSFFENIYLWGKNLTHYKFGEQLGKYSLMRDINSVNEDDNVDLKDGNEVTKIFVKAKKKSKYFEKSIIEDMRKLSYNLRTIEISRLKFIPAFGINVQERDREDITDQTEMSQGMFRALSLLIQLNYSLLSKEPSCILIDDIGEGLDYERSKALIDLIIKKVENSNIQVIMTTNDRFTMNKIPLKYWSVIQRLPKKSIFYNYRNSKEIFDDFEYTGLNNFDFFSTSFYTKGFETVKN